MGPPVPVAVALGDRVYLHVSHRSDAESRAATGGFAVVREGSAGAVLAIGATLDPGAARRRGCHPGAGSRGLAGELTVVAGYCEADGDARYNSVVCVNGDGVLGNHRKVHQPLGEDAGYASGDRFHAFDTSVGRIGMPLYYDKTFPESARSLALDGAEILACLSAWPTSITNRAPRMAQDRQAKLFDLYDQARAAENQVVLASSNQTGAMGGLRFLGQSKVVGPGDILARTWAKAGLAVAEVDIAAEIDRVRRVLRASTNAVPPRTDRPGSPS
ncbi:carbon-nitrogen hydrolase family protein [Streptomyces olivochromogenes]|uniref:Apolipoprotein N-acyltransferase n=1 Tax=Streptomyces olivochromogenes TaxID=1963 RepID=A0A250V6C1_STROL|nr:carbon-nitrogen hydrolase family protein [Streptomyces olivochromogenes]GAX49634.1 apolipoprotein N-acyltransferase [Streptomyces olivochromogenes]